MTTEKAPRIEPLLPPDWNEEMIDALNAFPGGLKFVQNGWAETGDAVRGTHMLGTFAQYPALAKAFLTFNNHVATNSTLSTRERELLILRMGWLRRSKYEFIMHVILGMRAGLSEEEVTRTQLGPDAEGWSQEDAELLRVADELCEHARISDASWQRLSQRYSEQQLMDMVFLVGCYDVVSMALLSFQIPMEQAELPLEEPFKSKMLNSFND